MKNDRDVMRMLNRLRKQGINEIQGLRQIVHDSKSSFSDKLLAQAILENPQFLEQGQNDGALAAETSDTADAPDRLAEAAERAEVRPLPEVRPGIRGLRNPGLPLGTWRKPWANMRGSISPIGDMLERLLISEDSLRRPSRISPILSSAS